MEAAKLQITAIAKEIEDWVVMKSPEGPGEGTNIAVVTYATNGESLSQTDPHSEDVRVFGVFKGVSSNEYLIERASDSGVDRYGVSETAPEGTELALEQVAVCPGDIVGVTPLNSHGERIWNQHGGGHGVLNLGVVVLNVEYEGGAGNEAELLDTLHDMAVDCHEVPRDEYLALTNDLDRMAYKTSGLAVQAWLEEFTKRVELDWGAADRGEWSPSRLSFVTFVNSVSSFSITLPTGNDVIYMMGLEYQSPPVDAYGYRDYNDNLVLLASDGTQSAVGKEFFVEEQNGRIGLRVLGCAFNRGACGISFNRYNVDLTKVRIKEPCAFALAASSSRPEQKMLNSVRAFRDRYMTVIPRASQYVDLYRRHTFELWRMVAAHREIREKAKTLLPNVVKLIQTMKDEKPATLEDPTVRDIKNLADLVLEKASPGLKDAISSVMPDLDKFSGKNMYQILHFLKQTKYGGRQQKS